MIFVDMRSQSLLHFELILIILVALGLTVTTMHISKLSAQLPPSLVKSNNLTKATQTAFIVKTIKLPTPLMGYRSQISINPNTNLIYVLTEKSVTVIDGRTNHVKGDIPRIYGQEGLAVNPNTNLIYTSNPFANTTTVIDGRTNSVLKEIKIPAGYPTQVAVNPNTNMVYVLSRGNSISVVDPRTNTVIKNIVLDKLSLNRRMAIDPVSNILYVTCSGICYLGPSLPRDHVSILDGKTNRIIGNISVPADDISVNPKTDMIYLTDGEMVHIINAKTHLENTITHDSNDHSFSFDNIVVNPLTNMIYTSNSGVNTTTVIDGRTNQEIRIIPVGFEPAALAANVKTNTVYILNTRDNTMSYITQAKP